MKESATLKEKNVDNGNEIVQADEAYKAAYRLETNATSTSEYSEQQCELKKGLSNRHVQLIAFGGCIGTGLFIGTGITLRESGPVPLVLSFVIISTFVYPIMCSLAEMICFLPQQGAVADLVARYVDPSLSFATGWNYAYANAMIVPAEMTAAASIVRYWTDAVPVAVWMAIFLVLIVALNFTAVQYYGESEFWFSSIKIICIFVLLIVSVVIFFGGAPTHDRIGFRYWKNPGPFGHYIAEGATGRLADVWTALVRSTFSFILSPELIGLACVEAKDTRRNIEKASKRFAYRIIFFYVSSALMISVILASNDPKLVAALDSNAPGAASSPFVQGIANAGIPIMDHVVNVAVLTAAWSAGNSFLYASSRLVLAQSKQGNAPKFLGKINRFGTPYNAVAVCSVFGALSFLNVSNSTGRVFTWLTNVSTISGFIGWAMIGISYIRFRKAVHYNNLQSRLPYRSPLQPYSAYYAVIAVSIITITNGYRVFLKGQWNTSNFIAAYINLPIFFGLYLGHKLYYKTRWYIPLEQIDVITGLEEAEQESSMSNFVPPKTLWQKFIYWLL
ncbi:HCL049Cp [Eremothecium sinecaudum]|uniref:HCL049Cp n=1 Tax=Eremothecium sinecaudum TaxID=45286 RepID=A0A120K213_9SACH|nr:HCL049Cp [Eremothecium sinecaudum]AMD20102.1 HCL049Cp [Eremothecium sinecaudum]